MDDLCGDFMAPVFRGALTPRLSRGRSLETFWSSRFGWGQSADVRGYDRTPLGLSDFAGYHWRSSPLVVFNAADVRRGARVAIGFPPLPRRLLLPRLDEQERKEGGEVRFPPGSLTDVTDGRSMSLARAVRVSANFPFGFNVLTIPRRSPPAEEADVYCAARDRGGQLVDPTDGVVKLLDGGVVDNTGMDTVYFALRGVERQAKQEGTRGAYARLWGALRGRLVVLIEIDSGQKPGPPGPLNRPLSGLLDSLDGLDNASFNNADMAKRRYLRTLRETFSRPGAPFFRHIKVECNHFDEPNVMTAWSLGTKDKGQVIQRWLVEWHRVRRELKDVETLARLAHQARQLSLRQGALKKGKDGKAADDAARKIQRDIQQINAEMAQTEGALQEKINRRQEANQRLFEKNRPRK
jgi:hypothetical protein